MLTTPSLTPFHHILRQKILECNNASYCTFFNFDIISRTMLSTFPKSLSSADFTSSPITLSHDIRLGSVLGPWTNMSELRSSLWILLFYNGFLSRYCALSKLDKGNSFSDSNCFTSSSVNANQISSPSYP